jgi:hypothetical protein
LVPTPQGQTRHRMTRSIRGPRPGGRSRDHLALCAPSVSGALKRRGRKSERDENPDGRECRMRASGGAGGWSRGYGLEGHDGACSRHESVTGIRGGAVREFAGPQASRRWM